MLRPVAVEHGWSPEKVNKGGLRNAVQTLSVSASPTILFVDLSESGDPLNDINALAEVCEPGTVVIAAGQVNDVRLYRDLVASGIQDYLLKPFSRRPAARRLRQCADDDFRPAPGRDRPTRSRNVMAAVIGVRGGVGASTVATSLAWLMGDKAGRSTALLDLDVHFGTGALALDLEPGRGLTDAIENPSRIDGLFIERAMVRANDKLCVLSAEAPINQPMLTDGSAFYQLQEEIRHAFEGTVIDLPRNMLVQYPAPADRRACRHRRGRVHPRRHARRDPHPVLAQGQCAAGAGDRRRQQGAGRRSQEVSRKDFEHSIERKVDIVLPFDAEDRRPGRQARPAARQGRPSRPSCRSRSTSCSA